jgi:hypothetical protein
MRSASPPVPDINARRELARAFAALTPVLGNVPFQGFLRLFHQFSCIIDQPSKVGVFKRAEAQS